MPKAILKMIVNSSVKNGSIHTQNGHLWYGGMVGSIEKLWGIVVDILDFNNKFRRRLKRLICLPVHCLSC